MKLKTRFWGPNGLIQLIAAIPSVLSATSGTLLSPFTEMSARWRVILDTLVFMVLIIVINLSLTNFDILLRNFHIHWIFLFWNLFIIIAIIMDKYKYMSMQLIGSDQSLNLTKTNHPSTSIHPPPPPSIHIHVTFCHLYLPIFLPIKLGSLWNNKLKFLCYKPIIPTCIFAIWGDYPMS